MVISPQLEQHEKEEKHKTWGDSQEQEWNRRQKWPVGRGCPQGSKVVQVVSKGQSLQTESQWVSPSVGHYSSPEEEDWHEQSQIATERGAQLRSALNVECDTGFCDGQHKDKGDSRIYIL